MKPIGRILACILLFSSCARLPEIVVDASSPQQSIATMACLDLFPEGKWQLVHNIQTITPDGRKGHLVGVIVLTSHTRKFTCVLMTIEGFVLFDAEFDKEVHINRGVPPFNSEAFAQGIVEDIQLLFLRPLGTLTASGKLSDGSRICRYGMPDGGIVDAIVHENGDWEINRYTEDQKRVRSVQASELLPVPGYKEVLFPTDIRLIAHGIMGYQLDMELVEAIPIE